MEPVGKEIEARETPIAEQLPGELISDCLRAADFLTRVRASHVSRTWRAAALADPHLWNTFSCRYFRDRDHQDAAFDQLETVLQRSHPLPFQLRIPHRYVGDDAEYARRLLAISQFDVRRLELYGGPPRVLVQLKADQLSLPTMTSLSFIDTHNSGAYDDWCELSPHWTPQCLPNLHSLAGPELSFRNCQHPFSTVRSLTCYLGEGNEWPPTFRLFPNLEHLELTASWSEHVVGTSREVKLPAGPLPASLESVVLRCDPSKNACDFCFPLADWHGERILRLLLDGAASVYGLMDIFLASHEHPARVIMTAKRQEVLFVAGPDGEYAWTIRATGYDEEFVASLKSLWSPRVTSISIAIEQLQAFLMARITAPGVVELELRLCGSSDHDRGADMRLPHLPLALFSFYAPRLRCVILNVDGPEADVRTHLNGAKAVLGMLVRSFRALFIYRSAAERQSPTPGQATGGLTDELHSILVLCYLHLSQRLVCSC